MKRESFNRDWTLNPLDGYEMFLNPDSVKPERNFGTWKNRICTRL